MATRCYLLSDDETKETLVIDPGDAPEYINETILARGLVPVAVAATHGHFDHVLGAYAVHTAFGIPFLLGEGDEFLLTRMQDTAHHFLGVESDPPPKVSRILHDRDTVLLGKSAVIIVALPGHTPGSVGFIMKDAGIAVTGDVLFADGSVGRTDHEYSDKKMFTRSVGRLLALPKHMVIYPGHGEQFSVSQARSPATGV
jgi:glyoxylase-like metal-dependent hydrolase (beta-lactamase superfamily II)